MTATTTKARENNKSATKRSDAHAALDVFLGRWRAEGSSFGEPNQSVDNPKGAPQPWASTHVATWHTGKLFLVQDERAIVGGRPFDTLSVMGVDEETGRQFVRSFDNLGNYRHYDLDADGQTWTITGPRERARIRFSADGRTQTINWEWCPKDRWLPLCDRVAHRED